MSKFSVGDVVRVTNVDGNTEVWGVGNTETITVVHDHGAWPIETSEFHAYSESELELAEEKNNG